VASAKLRNVSIHYRFDGAEEAPVVMLCNSLETNLSVWDAQLPALTRRYRVLRYDSRGHGQSEVTPGPYTIEQLARDALGLLDALGLAQVRFCGLSTGGMVGQWLGANAPSRLSRLVLCNTAARIGTQEIWNARIDAVNKGGIGRNRRRSTDSLVLRAVYRCCPKRHQRDAADAAHHAGRRLCRFVRRYPRHGSTRIGSQHRGDDLVISGAHDAATPAADGRFLAEHIAGAKYLELAAAHLSNIEAEAESTSALTAFLAD